MTTRWYAAGLLLVVLGSRSAGAEQCRGLRPIDDAVHEPPVSHVSTTLGLVCAQSPQLRRVEETGEPLALDCETVCAPRGPIAPGLYRLEDATGTVLGVVAQRAGPPSALVDALAADPRARRVRPIATTAVAGLVERAEQGGCSALREPEQLLAGREYVLESPQGASLLVVDADGPPAPAAPAGLTFVALPSRGKDAQEEPEQAFSRLQVVAPPGADALAYRWRVLDHDDREVIGPTISRLPTFVGFAEEHRSAARDLAMGAAYVLEIQTLARDGRASEPRRYPFEMTPTGEGCMNELTPYGVVGGFLAAVAYFVVALLVGTLVAIVTVSRRRRKRGAR